MRNIIIINIKWLFIAFEFNRSSLEGKISRDFSTNSYATIFNPTILETWRVSRLGGGKSN